MLATAAMILGLAFSSGAAVHYYYPLDIRTFESACYQSAHAGELCEYVATDAGGEFWSIYISKQNEKR